MRNKFQRLDRILHSIGSLLQILSLTILLPLIFVFIYWDEYGDGWRTFWAFVIPALSAFLCGLVLDRTFKPKGHIGMTGSMLLCTLGWIIIPAFGALPFVIAIKANYLNAYFEAVSGFTTTGITVFSGLDNMPRSILFWRALTQGLGGIGILSFFLMITFRGGGAHHIFGAESHKISSARPVPGLFNTVKILWAIYGALTMASIAILAIEGMPIFDSICHSFAALSTGGFSPYDTSIEYYSLIGHPNYRLIEYTLAVIMGLGGINFVIHYRVLTGNFKALWDNIEIRYWWGLLFGFIFLIMLDHHIRHGLNSITDLEGSFRYTAFQVVSVLTTTGFGTKDIGSSFFPAMAKQLFLLMMVIGGCVGSTSGGIKVLRVAILNRLIFREIRKLRVSPKAATELVIDKRIVPDEESHRVGAMFFAWIVIIAIGGAISALFSNQGAWESVSGMFSAMGNIGPCYISINDMINIHPVVKMTYIFGMLAGRLEILPLFLLFSRKAWF